MGMQGEQKPARVMGSIPPYTIMSEEAIGPVEEEADSLLRLLNGKTTQPPSTWKTSMNQVPAKRAHLFIVNPLTGSGFATLFSTHPPIAERVARLRAMASSRAR